MRAETIFIVDDTPANLGVLFEALERKGFEVFIDTDGEVALEAIRQILPDLILLDVIMPGTDGFEVCRRLKSDEATRDIPVIFMTALSETIDKIRGLQLGAVDYVTKPFHIEEVAARIRTHLTLRAMGRHLEERNQQLRIAKEAADAANRAKTEFLANISHEIRTPMNAILGFADLLSSLVKDEQQKSYLHAIKSGGKSLLTLLNDILDLSKIEAGKFEIRYEPVNPHTIFEEIRQIFSAKIAAKHLEFVMDISENIPESVMFDEVRLRQILFNLVGNAVKFTEKGQVKINARCEETRNDLSESDQNSPASHPASRTLHLSVEDTGIGIPREAMGMIFEPFRQHDGQSTRRYGGTGLGLAITKRLVQMMNGEIGLFSEVGKGSRFEMIFRDVEIAETIRKSGEAEEGGGRIVFEAATILVADDVKTNRLLIKAIFGEPNIRLIEAENGQQAVLLTEHYKPDLILMDIRMPVMSGYEAAELIRSNPKLRDIPIIALTASVTNDEKEKITRGGFDGYVPKPVRHSELRRILRRFLAFVEYENQCEPRCAAETLPSETLEKLPEIIEQLETEFGDQWKHVSRSGNFEEIENFANRIAAFGERYSLNMLVRLGKELRTHAADFDIDNIEAAMNSYPDLLETIKSLRKGESS